MDWAEYSWRTAVPNDDGFEVLVSPAPGPWRWVADALAHLKGTDVARDILDLACEQALDDKAPALLERVNGAGFDAGHALAARLVAVYAERYGPAVARYDCARLREIVVTFIVENEQGS
jgi:hypothetical protein